MSFADQITSLAIPETTASDDVGAPRIWWRNGVNAGTVKTAGAFYTKQDEFAGGLAAPWEIVSRYENETGYGAEQLKIAVLAWRSQPFRDPKDATGKKIKDGRREWFLKWEEGMQLYTEALCFVEGTDTPAVFCCDGMTGRAVSGKGGILKSYQAGLLSQASLVAKRGLPLWTFWIPIATKRNSDGKIAYVDTGFGSLTTPPAAFYPANAMDVLFVGQELLTRGAEILNTTHLNWAKTIPPHRLPGNVINATDYSISEVPQLSAPIRNVPQPIEADDTY
jgi:hypothetical protein